MAKDLMNEQDWFECNDSARMLGMLRGKASHRKLILFSVSCCRHVWPLFSDDRSRHAVEVIEQWVDGSASQFELEAAQAGARAAIPQQHPARGVSVGTRSWRNLHVNHAVARAAWCAAHGPEYVGHAAQQSNIAAKLRGLAAVNEPTRWQCDLLRDIFGNPFRPVAFDPAWRTANVTAIAATIYAERRFADLPILADALEEAGCTSAELLGHCRQPGEHLRGCWAADLVLGKE